MKPKLQEDQILEIIRLYQEGMPMSRIAPLFKVTAGAIKKRLAQRKIPFRSKAEVYQLMREQGIEAGPRNPAWKGGRQKPVQGYVRVFAPTHPRALKGRVHEHILVAEVMLGRYLFPEEVVHHINEVRDDNRPENLQVMTKSAHKSLHFSQKRKFMIVFAKEKGLSITTA